MSSKKQYYRKHEKGYNNSPKEGNAEGSYVNRLDRENGEKNAMVGCLKNSVKKENIKNENNSQYDYASRHRFRVEELKENFMKSDSSSREKSKSCNRQERKRNIKYTKDFLKRNSSNDERKSDDRRSNDKEKMERKYKKQRKYYQPIMEISRHRDKQRSKERDRTRRIIDRKRHYSNERKYKELTYKTEKEHVKRYVKETNNKNPSKTEHIREENKVQMKDYAITKEMPETEKRKTSETTMKHKNEYSKEKAISLTQIYKEDEKWGKENVYSQEQGKNIVFESKNVMHRCKNNEESCVVRNETYNTLKSKKIQGEKERKGNRNNSKDSYIEIKRIEKDESRYSEKAAKGNNEFTELTNEENKKICEDITGLGSKEKIKFIENKKHHERIECKSLINHSPQIISEALYKKRRNENEKKDNIEKHIKWDSEEKDDKEKKQNQEKMQINEEESSYDDDTSERSLEGEEEQENDDDDNGYDSIYENKSDSDSQEDEMLQLECIHNGCRSVKNYKKLNKISSGTYGTVYRARNRKTNRIVALKRLKNFSNMKKEGFAITSLREIDILLQLKHKNILSVKEVVIGKHLNDIYLVMKYVEHELKILLDNKSPSFTIAELKCLLKQLLNGLNYLHQNWVMHRDLKTTNLLYNNKGILKICDFGMSRKFSVPCDKNLTMKVVTLWYRAPELLLGEKKYTNKIDIWSAGCIFGEFFLKQPLFAGENEYKQIMCILQILGLPSQDTYPTFYEYPYITQNRDFFKKHEKKFNNNKIYSIFPSIATQFSGSGVYLSESGFDLLQKMLRLNPEERISAEEALNHPYFNEVPKPAEFIDMPRIPDTNKMVRSAKMEQRVRMLKSRSMLFHF